MLGGIKVGLGWQSRTSIFVSISIILLMLSLLYIGYLPVHRTQISHTDSEGDITDPNADILSYRSYRQGFFIVLELVVAGEIISGDIDDVSGYLYRLSIVGKFVGSNDSHIYSCAFQDGIVESYLLDSEIQEDTLRIFFPLSIFLKGSYMIGLEASAYSVLDEEDLGAEDREADIQHLLF